VVLRVLPSKTPALIRLPDRLVPTGQTSGGMEVHQPYEIERELNLVSGETIDLGTVKIYLRER
jgi:hypothetical protein